jgi:hypothetical protein
MVWYGMYGRVYCMNMVFVYSNIVASSPHLSHRIVVNGMTNVFCE